MKSWGCCSEWGNLSIIDIIFGLEIGIQDKGYGRSYKEEH